MAFTCTSLLLNLYTSVFGSGCGFGFSEQKFWRIDGFGKKRHGSADLHTPIQPPLETLVKIWENSKKLWKRAPTARVATDFSFSQTSTRVLGSFSAARSCLLYPPREETAARVSGKPCLWRKFIIDNHWRAHMTRAARAALTFEHVPFSPPLLLILVFQPILFHTIFTVGYYMLCSKEKFV